MRKLIFLVFLIVGIQFTGRSQQIVFTGYPQGYPGPHLVSCGDSLEFGIELFNSGPEATSVILTLNLSSEVTFCGFGTDVDSVNQSNSNEILVYLTDINPSSFSNPRFYLKANCNSISTNTQSYIDSVKVDYEYLTIPPFPFLGNVSDITPQYFSV